MGFVKMINKIKTKGQYFQVNLKPNRLLFYLLTKLDTRLGTKTLKKNIFFHLHHSSFFIFMFCSFAKSLSQEILWLFQIALLNFANFWPHKIWSIKVYCSYFEPIIVHKTSFLGWDLHLHQKLVRFSYNLHWAVSFLVCNCLFSCQ